MKNAEKKKKRMNLYYSFNPMTVLCVRNSIAIYNILKCNAILISVSILIIVALGLVNGVARCIKLCLFDLWLLQAICGP